jgi:hypothetical protein
VGRAVELAEELGPLEEAALGHPLFEPGAIDEFVIVVGLTGTSGTGGPRPTEPQSGIVIDETRGDGSLPRPARARENEDQDFAV